MLTRDFILQEIGSLRTQRDNALAVFQQATGAIALAEALLAKMDEEPVMTMTEEQLSDAIAASGMSMAKG